MKKYLTFIAICILSLFSLSAQDTLKNFYFKDEWSIGIYAYNNGWGFDYRSGKFLNPKSKKIWEIGYKNIKHPKEYRQESLWLNGKYYVYGKLNKCYTFYFGIGKQHTLIPKNGDKTVEIKLLGIIGTNLALLKPIYYEVYNPKDSSYIYSKFDISQQPGTILAEAPFSMGLEETKFIPGIYSKLALNVDFSKKFTSINAVEIGIRGALFLKKLNIMSQVENYNFFMALFLSYRLGKIYQGNRRQVIFD